VRASLAAGDRSSGGGSVAVSVAGGPSDGSGDRDICAVSNAAHVILLFRTTVAVERDAVADGPATPAGVRGFKRFTTESARMNADEFTDTLRDDHETPLSRLGSSKSLYALTGGEMDGASVRAAAAGEATVTADVLDDWADDATGEPATLYADIAADAESHVESADADPTARAFPEYDRLADAETPADRLGGLLAALLLAETRASQMVGFFVGDADPTTASTFRDVRSDYESNRERVGDRLETVCDAEADWDAARETADDVLETAYDDYVETLESMGVKPKNVC
jgi:hypothetical protein